jgi:thiol-disulfide isomerase/thioredoxin
MARDSPRPCRLLRAQSTLVTGLGEHALPLDEEGLDVAPLCLGERGPGDEATHLGHVAVLDGSLEVLALGGRLTELTADPAAEADPGLVELSHERGGDGVSTRARLHPARSTDTGPDTLALVTGRRLFAASVVVALVGLAASVTAGLILADGDGAASSPDARSGTVAAEARAPAIMGRDPVTGATVSLARVKKKPIVLAVWASWCTACARQASALRKFAQEHRGRRP